jgi:uncharacterized protein
LALNALRALYDVNVLIALLDPYHLKHDRALAWHVAHGGDGWASCPITQNGLVRIMSQTKYSNPQTTRDMLEVVSEFANDSAHEFWQDSISIADPTFVDANVPLTPSMLTDVYLLALAVKNQGRLITLDSKIFRSAARGAREEQLVVIY